MISPDFSLLFDPGGDNALLAAQAPRISIIVPVRNEARHIERTLYHLVTQRYDPRRFEILVIDGMSTDGTVELVEAFAQRHRNVRLYFNPRRLSSAARNIGVRNAQGDIIVVVDGHCELATDRYLCHLAAAFEQSGADCVGRPQPLDFSGATPLERSIAAARSSRLGHHPDSFIYSSHEGFVPAKSVAVAYRRRVFDAIGLFDEDFDACEDVEFNHRVDRAGLRCYFTPRVAVGYRPRTSLAGLFRQLVRYGRGRVRLLRKHPETLAVRTMAPLLFVMGLIAGIPLGIAAPAAMTVYLGVLAVYAAIILAASVAIGIRRRDLALVPRLPLVLATVHVASGTGMLLELCQPLGGEPPREEMPDSIQAN